jgi:hypothetical protein
MDPRELAILEEIEAAAYADDAAFAELIAGGPRMSIRHRAGLAAATAAGVGLMVLFTTSLVFGLAGYLVLVAVGTDILRNRSAKVVKTSPLETFHTVTRGLFRDRYAGYEAPRE